MGARFGGVRRRGVAASNQLRELLGDYFLSLDSSAGGFVVTVSGPGKAYHTEAELDAADAYARATFSESRHCLASLRRGSRLELAIGELKRRGPVTGRQRRHSIDGAYGNASRRPRTSRSTPTSPPTTVPSSRAHHSKVHELAAAAAPSSGANRTSPKPKPPRESSHTSR